MSSVTCASKGENHLHDRCFTHWLVMIASTKSIHLVTVPLNSSAIWTPSDRPASYGPNYVIPTNIMVVFITGLGLMHALVSFRFVWATCTVSRRGLIQIAASNSWSVQTLILATSANT